MFRTPINDIMKIGSFPRKPRPTTIPKAPDPNNITNKSLSLRGLTYLIDVLLKIEHY